MKTQLYYSSNTAASIDEPKRDGKLVTEMDFKFQQKLGYFVLQNTNREDLILSAMGWAAFVELDELPTWIMEGLYPDGWQSERAGKIK